MTGPESNADKVSKVELDRYEDLSQNEKERIEFLEKQVNMKSAISDAFP